MALFENFNILSKWNFKSNTFKTQAFQCMVWGPGFTLEKKCLGSKICSYLFTFHPLVEEI